eukprot:TRINITY_DN26404_c0_g1_i1.p1 TRINITY_DN26404_c0_g1~~TRINITY_DN26404_c0_g1_i1.p1  ORF type:complete len:1346 (+),score=216.29 TRINITY_DN26404_c0_g1_i1:465-4040(+)
MEKMWPICLEKFASQQMVPALAPWFLRKYKPWMVRNAILRRIHLGSAPPLVSAARVVPTSGFDDHVVLETAFDFVVSEDMQVELAGQLWVPDWIAARFPHFTQTWAPLIVSNLIVEGKMCIGLKFIPEFPYVSRVRLCFSGPPYISVRARPLFKTAIDVAELPGVAGWIDRLLAHALKDSMVEPNMLVVNAQELVAHFMPSGGAAGAEAGPKLTVSPTMKAPVSLVKEDMAPPCAQALIEILEGAHLKAADVNGFSYPYVKGALGAARFKTSVKRKTLAPQWLEEFSVPIVSWEDPNLLVLRVCDKEMSKSDELGNCVVDLSKFRGGQRFEFWEILRGVKIGRLHLAITITELPPPLPKKSSQPTPSRRPPSSPFAPTSPMWSAANSPLPSPTRSPSRSPFGLVKGILNKIRKSPRASPLPSPLPSPLQSPLSSPRPTPPSSPGHFPKNGETALFEYRSPSPSRPASSPSQTSSRPSSVPSPVHSFPPSPSAQDFASSQFLSTFTGDPSPQDLRRRQTPLDGALDSNAFGGKRNDTAYRATKLPATNDPPPLMFRSISKSAPVSPRRSNSKLDESSSGSSADFAIAQVPANLQPFPPDRYPLPIITPPVSTPVSTPASAPPVGPPPVGSLSPGPTTALASSSPSVMTSRPALADPLPSPTNSYEIPPSPPSLFPYSPRFHIKNPFGEPASISPSPFPAPRPESFPQAFEALESSENGDVTAKFGSVLPHAGPLGATNQPVSPNMPRLDLSTDQSSQQGTPGTQEGLPGASPDGISGLDAPLARPPSGSIPSGCVVLTIPSSSRFTPPPSPGSNRVSAAAAALSPRATSASQPPFQGGQNRSTPGHSFNSLRESDAFPPPPVHVPLSSPTSQLERRTQGRSIPQLLVSSATHTRHHTSRSPQPRPLRTEMTSEAQAPELLSPLSRPASHAGGWAGGREAHGTGGLQVEVDGTEEWNESEITQMNMARLTSPDEERRLREAGIPSPGEAQGRRARMVEELEHIDSNDRNGADDSSGINARVDNWPDKWPGRRSILQLPSESAAGAYFLGMETKPGRELVSLRTPSIGGSGRAGSQEDRRAEAMSILEQRISIGSPAQRLVSELTLSPSTSLEGDSRWEEIREGLESWEGSGSSLGAPAGGMVGGNRDDEESVRVRQRRVTSGTRRLFSPGALQASARREPGMGPDGDLRDAQG